MSEPVLSLRGVVKSYAGKRVLDGIDLDLGRGEALVVMGPSGTGKTVLLKHLIGLIRPDAGTLYVEGNDFWSLPEHERTRIRRRYGIAFQEGALFDSMTVFDNIAFPMRRQQRWSREQVKARVAECLRRVRLSGVEQRYPAELSTGMRRRAGFARAIALTPELLLFDEPTAGLDPVMVTVMSELIRSLGKTLGSAMVLVTHDLRTARLVGDRLALLFQGKLVANASADEFERLASPYVQQFVHGTAEGPLTQEALEESGAAAREAR